jgi:hypothetical protein
MPVRQYGKVTIHILSTLEKALDLSTVRDSLALEYAYALPTGSDAGQADRLFHDQRTIAAGASDDVTLRTGVSDAFGDTVSFAEVRALILRADADNGADLVLSIPVAAGLGSPPITEQVLRIPPGGAVALIAPGVDGSPATGRFAVAAGTWDVLSIVNMDLTASATYDVIVLGVSA